MSSASSTGPDNHPAANLGPLLHDRGYLSLLLVAALLGAPLSLIAFGFLAAVHELEHWIWHELPHDLGFDHLPEWWPILTLGLAGVLVALAVKYLPGHGGHVPVEGLGAGPTAPVELPGILLAAAASLVLGGVVGPEAPLIALGGGLALLAISRTRIAGDPSASALVAACGSAAAIAAIFGNPVVAAVIFLEIGELARRQTLLLILPALVSSGVGALVFTGLGNWTGLGIGALALPDLTSTDLHISEVLWVFPLSAAIAVGTWAAFSLGRRTAALASTNLVATTIGAALLVGASACFYALITDHSPDEVALSGQATLGMLASDPGAWTNGALVLLLLCKGLAYGWSIGVLRGGPIFPAIFLGAAAGVLASNVLPGLDTVPALSLGMAAGVAVMGLPVTGIILVTLLLGDAAASQMPVVILAAVTALVVGELLSTRASASNTQRDDVLGVPDQQNEGEHA